MGWGRRKDNNQPYIKSEKKGIAGSSSNTKPVGDVHMKMPRELEKLMEVEHQRNLVMDFAHGTTWFDLEKDLSKLSHNDKIEALKLLRKNMDNTERILGDLLEIKNPDSFEKHAIDEFERQLEITEKGIKELKKLLGIK